MHMLFKIGLFTLLISCQNSNGAKEVRSTVNPDGSFGYDVQFLKSFHKDLVLLGDDSTSAQVAILPAYQGRVMTSSVEGWEGHSLGWINHEHIASGEIAPHINVYGGEERIWLGPEGGQFSIYFKKDAPFVFDNWFVPKELDIEPFRLVSANKQEAIFEKKMSVENYAGNTFDLVVNRTIKLLKNTDVTDVLDLEQLNQVKWVGFESINRLTNTGSTSWDKKTGMLSVWILSMLNATDKTTVIVPFKKGDERQLGKIVTDDYFGKPPADRLKVEDDLLLFKADAKHRSKIGISPSRALPFMLSYDDQHQVLTIAEFSLPKDAKDYVNSLWEIQDQPFSGDAVNAYNDGLLNGKQLGKFYELESSSPAAALAPNQSITHTHKTIHIKGSKDQLNKIVLRLTGRTLEAIQLK